MKIDIMAFGKISEFIQNQEMDIVNIDNMDKLKQYLEQSFPQLAGIKYKLALNKDVVQTNLKLSNKDSIAIMPPFSGG